MQAFIIFTVIAILMVVGNRIRANENAKQMPTVNTRLEELLSIDRKKMMRPTYSMPVLNGDLSENWS